MTTVLARAGLLAIALAVATVAADAQSGYDLFQKALATERADGNLKDAIQLYERVVEQSSSNRSLAARALLRIGECYEKLGQRDAVAAYERIVREFDDQGESVALARARLASVLPLTEPGERARQLATVRDTDYPRLSLPDGRYLTFRTPRVGELVVRDLRSGAERRLTKAQRNAYAGASVVSPAGREIAYAWSDDTIEGVELRTLPIDATDATKPRTIRRADANDAQLEPFAWTPDGSRLLVIRTLRDRSKQLAVVSVSDGSMRVLKSVGWRYPVGALSPDGRYIAYELESGDGVAERDIFVLSVDGSREAEVIRHPADDLRPVWTPDGAQLLFLSDRTGNRSLWRIAIERGRATGEPQLVRPDFGPGLLLGMTRRGGLHYFVWGGGRNVYTAELASDMTLATTPVVAAERYVNANGAPSWSPDGLYLAYYSFRQQRKTVLVVRTLRGGNEREIPLDIAVSSPFGDAPKWFPDGQSVLVVASGQARQGSVGYYRVTLSNGETVLLHRPKAWGPPAFQPAISVDGNALFYLDYENEPPTNALMRFQLDTTEESTVARAPAGYFLAAFALSGDGTRAAVITTDERRTSSAIGVLPVNGGQIHELAPGTAVAPNTQLVWTPDQTHLLFTDAAHGDAQGLWRVPVGGGPATRTGLSASQLRAVSVHPDGRRIAFESRQTRGNEMWVFENILPAPR